MQPSWALKTRDLKTKPTENNFGILHNLVNLVVSKPISKRQINCPSTSFQGSFLSKTIIYERKGEL